MESVSFYWYIKTNSLISMQQVCENFLTFDYEEEKEAPQKSEAGVESAAMGEGPATPQPATATEVPVRSKLSISHADYLLGVADLTGELMRLATNAVARNDFSAPHQVLEFLRAIDSAFFLVPTEERGLKDLPAKLAVLKVSLAKVEQLCYSLKVRGSEFPQAIAAQLSSLSATASENSDE